MISPASLKPLKNNRLNKNAKKLQHLLRLLTVVAEVVEVVQMAVVKRVLEVDLILDLKVSQKDLTAEANQEVEAEVDLAQVVVVREETCRILICNLLVTIMTPLLASKTGLQLRLNLTQNLTKRLRKRFNSSLGKLFQWTQTVFR